jgi:hypothetical protein
MTIQLFPNAILANAREVQKDGATWLVIPGVPIREMVLNYYFVPGDEIAHFTGAWNGIPVTVRHPKNNNGAANVPTPDVPVIGRLYESDWDESESKLMGEYWINVADAERTIEGQGIIDRVRAGKSIETSTGYYADEEPAEGIYGGKKYTAIHRNLRPEHVAILPDDVGACSLRDGCGVNRNCEQVTANCAGCPCGGGQQPEEPGAEIESSQGEAALSSNAHQRDQSVSQNEEKDMSKKKSIVMDLLALLGVKVNDASALQVEEDPENTETPPAEGDPASPAQAAPAQPPAQNSQEGQLTHNELTDIRGYINLMTEFGGPEGFKKLLAAMQEVGQVQQNAASAAKAQMVGNLVANSRCPFAQTELEAMTVEQLTKLAQALAPVNYAGLGLESVSQNAGADNAPKPVLSAKPEKAK